MESANDIFYLITDKIIELQGFFLNVANTIARIVLLVAILIAAVNYALTGTGLKENVIKIGKAFVFFSIVIFFYPRIISWITDVTFNLAIESTYNGRLYETIHSDINEMKKVAEEKRYNNNNWTASAFILTEPKYTESEQKSDNIFEKIIAHREISINGKIYNYSTVAPSFALHSVFLIASEIFQFAEVFDWRRPFKIFGALICGFFTIVVGCFCVLEYLIAYLEFMFVSSVGVILFPLSLWDGTKFMAEKYIGAMLGFFVKLLFSSICMFLMLWVFTSIAKEYTETSFVGEVLQIIPLFLSSLLIFYLCKSAPALAQSLISGSPSLTGAGAIGMVASGVMAVAKLSHLAGGSGQGTGSLPTPSTSAAITAGSGGTSTAGSGGTSIASQTPPPFIASQSAASLALPAPQQQQLAIEDRTADLTKSLTYTSRPLIEGPGGASVAIPAPVYYTPNNRQQALSFGGYSGDNRGKANQGKTDKGKPAGSDVTYEVLG
jgi:type IV secretory pathway TrbL component